MSCWGQRESAYAGDFPIIAPSFWVWGETYNHFDVKHIQLILCQFNLLRKSSWTSGCQFNRRRVTNVGVLFMQKNYMSSGNYNGLMHLAHVKTLLNIFENIIVVLFYNKNGKTQNKHEHIVEVQSFCWFSLKCSQWAFRHAVFSQNKNLCCYFWTQFLKSENFAFYFIHRKKWKIGSINTNSVIWYI